MYLYKEQPEILDRRPSVVLRRRARAVVSRSSSISSSAAPACVWRDDGFRIKQPWKWRFVLWKDASEFGVGSTALIEQPQERLVDGRDLSTTRMSTRARSQPSTAASSAAIPRLPDTYGLSPEDLQALMNRWRERALRGA